MFSADVEPIASGFIVLAASRIARQARRRTAGGTSVPEIRSRRVAIASEARERTSAQPPPEQTPNPYATSILAQSRPFAGRPIPSHGFAGKRGIPEVKTVEIR